MNTILVPTDFSQVATNAMEEAINIAKRINAEVTLLHVVEEGTSSSFQVSGEYVTDDPQEKIFMMKLIKLAEDKLNDLKETYADVNIKTELRMGNPYYGITDIIKSHEVDLVVMGTTGSSGLEEILVGSNAEKVVRQANCPVLTINQKTGKPSCDNIVLATSMSDDDSKLIKVVKRIQADYNSTIHLVWVNTPNTFERERKAKKMLNDYASSKGLENFTVNIYNDISEEEGIVCFADDLDADLICMVTHRRSGLGHLIAGSIAEDVVNHSKRPVLTVGIG